MFRFQEKQTVGTVSQLPPSLSETGRGSLPSLKSAVFMGTPARLSRGQPLCPAQVSRPERPEHPEHPAHPAAASGLSLGSQPPTFSWALLNFFCTCLAKRPAAPPARPSAILPTPSGAASPGPAPCGFLEAPRGGSAFPSCLASGQAGLAQVTPPRCRLGITLDRLRPRARPDAAGNLRNIGPGRRPSPRQAQLAAPLRSRWRPTAVRPGAWPRAWARGPRTLVRLRLELGLFPGGQRLRSAFRRRFLQASFKPSTREVENTIREEFSNLGQDNVP